MRPEDHAGPTLEQMLDDLPTQRQRIHAGVGVWTLPGGRIEHDGWPRLLRYGSPSDRDRFHLRTTDDAELLAGDDRPVPGVAVNTCLASDEDEVVDRVHRVVGRGLLGISVIETNMGQLAPLDEMGVANGVVDVESGCHRGHDGLLQASQT